MCYDVGEKINDVFICEARGSEHLDKTIVTIVVCCLSCVKFLVNLFDVAGMKERTFTDCYREHLRSSYSNSYNDFYFHPDNHDADFSDNDQESEELITNQFWNLYCFTELRLYNFKYTRLCCNCRKTLKVVFDPKLHIASL